MIKRLISQVAESFSATAYDKGDGTRREEALRLATAVLMIDVARADHVFDDSEFDRVLQLVQSHFHLAPEQAAALVNTADEKAENLVSLHEFTQLLNNNLDAQEKSRIVSLLWQIAYADGQLDKYEDSLVLKISDLLHVSRGRVMRLKHDAERGED
jgi:uncharacterized tellurite resistance protein B-like protein